MLGLGSFAVKTARNTVVNRVVELVGNVGVS